jgi:hypothetical protein
MAATLDPTKNLGSDSTATFEDDPPFLDSNPGATGSSENIEEQRDTDDIADSEEEEDDDVDEDEDLEADEADDDDDEVDDEAEMGVAQLLAVGLADSDIEKMMMPVTSTQESARMS